MVHFDDFMVTLNAYFMPQICKHWFCC